MQTTIQITKELRDKIKDLGTKGESYNEIIERLYESALERQLQDLLLSSKGTISIDEAMRRHKARWHA